MNWGELLSLAVFVIFTENFVLVKCLGVPALLGKSEKLSTALGMGAAVTAVMTLATLCTWAVNSRVLVPLGLDGHLQTLAFVLIIAVLAALVEMGVKKAVPARYETLGINLPLLTTNCAVLGVVLLNARYGYDLGMSVACGLLGGLGFTLAMVLFASLRERLEFAECPKAFEGAPIALVSAGLLAMVFMGFSGLSLG